MIHSFISEFFFSASYLSRNIIKMSVTGKFCEFSEETEEFEVYVETWKDLSYIS